VKARQLHRKEHFDALWAMMAHTAGVPAALFAAAYRATPYVLTLQEGDPPQAIERQMRVFGPLFRAAFSRARIVQAISVFLADWGLRMGARDTVIIPNGVDIRRFSEKLSSHDRAYIRQRLGVRDGEVLLVTSSRLVRKNGVDVVLDALKDVPENVRFLILGDGPERQRLEAQAHRLGLASRAMFAGEVPNGHLPEYLHASDMFVRASRSEGQGISFIEALAAGLPTIGTAVGGIPDFLKEGQTGFVAEVCDPKAIASAVLRALEDPEKTAKIAARGQALSKEYEWDILAGRMKKEVFDPLWK
jgi:glycosyltransferase involved in cell wall biosynthesis